MVLFRVRTVQKVHTSDTRVCVYCMCRQELRRVQSSAGDGHGQSHGPPLDPASLPSLPLHILVFRAQTSTQISIHSLSVSSSVERGEREGSERTGKDRAYQIVLVLGLLFVLLCFKFCYVRSGKQRQLETKGPFRKQRVRSREKERKRMWRERKCSQVEGKTLQNGQGTTQTVTISVHGTRGWAGVSLCQYTADPLRPPDTYTLIHLIPLSSDTHSLGTC